MAKILTGGKIFFSAEADYKTMRHVIGYDKGTNLFFNTDFESKLVQGKGRAYGFEILTISIFFRPGETYRLNIESPELGTVSATTQLSRG